MWAGPSLPCPRRKDGEDARTFLGGERNLRPALAAQRGHLCCPANGGPDGRPLLRQYPCCSGSRILSGRLRDPYQRGPQCAVPCLLRAGPQERGAKPARHHPAMVVACPAVVGGNQRALLAPAPTDCGAAPGRRTAAPATGQRPDIVGTVLRVWLATAPLRAGVRGNPWDSARGGVLRGLPYRHVPAVWGRIARLVRGLLWSAVQGGRREPACYHDA